MATLVEAKPFVSGLSLTQSEKKPFPVFTNNHIVLIISGIGKANAAMATAYGCSRFKPACICNLGAAGATNRSFKLGEAVQIDKIVEFDRPELRTQNPQIHLPDTLEGFQTAVLSTSDKVVVDSDERKKVAKLAGLVDMEGASVVQTCRRFETRCHVFKFVSDTPGHTHDMDIINHIRSLREPFYEFINQSVLPLLWVS